MKAKEYFGRHILNEPFESEHNKMMAVKNVRDMLIEVREIAHKRCVKTDSGLRSILLETIEKFRAYNMMIEKHYMEKKLKDDAILLFVENEMPDIYDDVKFLIK